MAKEASVLTKVHFAWHMIQREVKQVCPRCGQDMYYLGESCNLDNSIDKEFLCTCTNAIQQIKELPNW